MVISPFSLQRLYITGELKIVQGRSVSIREETKFTGYQIASLPSYTVVQPRHGNVSPVLKGFLGCSLTRAMRNPMDIEIFRYEKWERNLKHVKENTLFDEK